MPRFLRAPFAVEHEHRHLPLGGCCVSQAVPTNVSNTYSRIQRAEGRGHTFRIEEKRSPSGEIQVRFWPPRFLTVLFDVLIIVQPASAVAGPPCRITNSATRWMVGLSLTLIAAAESSWPSEPLAVKSHLCTAAATGWATGCFAPAAPFRLAPAAAPPPEALCGPSRPSRRPSRRCSCRGASRFSPS